MKIYLPWKVKTFGGSYHQATLEILYWHTQHEDNQKAYEERKQLDLERVNKVRADKKEQSGLRKCLGHKPHKGAIYDEHGQCSICKGYLR